MTNTKKTGFDRRTPEHSALSLGLGHSEALLTTGALQSAYEGYVPKTRVVLFEAALAAANGLSFDDALGSITRDAARILGIDQRVGSIEKGKDADLACFDGDPFEYTSHCTTTIIDGKVVSDKAN